MKRLCVSSLLLFAFVVALLFPITATYAGGIEVISNSHQNNFPTDITFNLSVKATSRITGITFYYKEPDDPNTAFSYPQFKSSDNVETQYKMRATGGMLAPTSRINYYWQISDEEGNVIKTPVKTVIAEDVRFQWKTVSQDGLTLYWYDGSQNRAEELLGSAVKALNRLSEQAGINYEKPIRILVYASKKDMEAILPRRSESFGREVSTLGIRLTPEVLAVLGDHSEIKSTLAHELSHQVVDQAVNNPYGDIPAWLDEGLAMNAEGDLPKRNKDDVQTAIKNDDLISVRSLSSYTVSPKEVNLFYGEAHSVVKFLTDTYGREKMRELLGTFKEGTGYDEALKRVYGLDMEGLDAKWRESVGAKPRNLENVGESKPRENSQSLPILSQLNSILTPRLLLAGTIISGFLGVLFFAGGIITYLVGRKK